MSNFEEKFCNFHHDVKADYFCLDHHCTRKGPVCEKCVREGHQEHESIFPITDIFEFLTDHVFENIKCPDKEDEHLEEIEGQINKKLQEVLQDIDQFEEYILSKTSQLRKLIEKEQSSLNEKLSDIFEFRELFKKTSCVKPLSREQSAKKADNLEEQTDETQPNNMQNKEDENNSSNEMENKSNNYEDSQQSVNVNETLKATEALFVNILQGVDVSSIMSGMKGGKRGKVLECKKFLNTNNQKLHIKDFRLSEPAFLQSLILKKISLQIKKITAQTSSKLQKLTDKTTCQFIQHNHFQFKKINNQYLEEKLFQSQPNERKEDNKGQIVNLFDGGSDHHDKIQIQQIGSFQQSLKTMVMQNEKENKKEIESSDQIYLSQVFSNFEVDPTAIGNKITHQNQIIEQQGLLQRYTFLKPCFSETDKEVFKVKIRILKLKSWIAVGVANKDILVSQDQLKFVSGTAACMISLNGYVYMSEQEPIKEFEQFKINPQDTITLIFSLCPPNEASSSLEIWLNETELLKQFNGTLFSKHELPHLAFCIGLLKGDSIEVL